MWELKGETPSAFSERQGERIVKNFKVNNNLYHQVMTIDARIREFEKE